MAILRQIVNNEIMYTIESTDTTIQFQATPAQALDLLNLFEGVKQQILEDTTPTVVNTGPDTTFHGFIEFNQDNGSANATHPDLVGTTLMYRWSDLNPAEGTYDWTKIETNLTEWAGKKVIVRVSASGWKGWKPDNASWTPEWVYAKGAKSVKVDDGSIKPVYWDKTFLKEYATFLQAFGQKYNLDPRILAIEMGIGDGGETKVDTSKFSDRLKKWKAVGYTDQIWLATIKELIAMYKAAFPTTPLILMPDASFLGSTYHESDVLSLAIAEGCWLQENGLVPGEVLNSEFTKTTVIMEQRNASTDANTLDQEIATALKNKAAYVLIFTSSIADTNQAAVLAKYAAQAQ